MGYRSPGALVRPAYRCQNGLKVGTATASGGIIYELVAVGGSDRVRVRIKTATNGGTLDVIPVGPDFDVTAAGVVAGTTAYASLTGTIYTTGTGTASVTAGTEAKVDLTLQGEEYLLLKFTGSTGAGTITYVDLCQVATVR